MKSQRDIPIMIYMACLFLSMIFWYVMDSSRIDGWARNFYFIFVPLTATPYILWVVHKEGQEPEEYFKDFYNGNALLMWGLRVFMMIVVSVLSSVATIVIFGALAYVYGLFK